MKWSVTHPAPPVSFAWPRLDFAGPSVSYVCLGKHPGSKQAQTDGGMTASAAGPVTEGGTNGETAARPPPGLF